MIKKTIYMISSILISSLNAHALDIYDLIKPANPLENSVPVIQDFYSPPKKINLTRNDIHNQYAISMNRFFQCNVKSAYEDFLFLIENTAPTDYMYLQLSKKMAELGFFTLSDISMQNSIDDGISHFVFADVKKFYYPIVKMNKEDEIYLAEMFSSIVYNDQSKEVVAELLKNTTLLEKYDYANYVTALGLFKSDNIIEAEKYINSAIAKNPENLNYKKLQAEILTQTQKPQNVLKIIDKIKQENLLTVEFNQKVQSTEKYLLYKIQKNEFEKKKLLAQYYYLENDLNKAMRVLHTSFNTKKKHNKNIYALLSKVYFDLNDYKKAEENATKAYKMDRSNSTSLIVLGDLAYKNNDFEKALKYYSNAVSSDYNNAQIKLAKTYQKLGNEEKAVNIYTKVIKTCPLSYEAYYELALIDKSKEQEYLKKALAINPQYPEAWIDMGRLEIEKKNFEKATSYLSTAKYIDENNFRYYYYQGLVFKNLGLPADAKRCFRKSLKLNPNFLLAKKELDI